ncbi:capsular biosynthesis protein [Campylobacter sp. MIT 19-121]|uniref:capsule polysaccharide modification protein KpsS n=1 Tax=Campylobacter sp. MIT 19-121 TaxID=2703906 RepID=UPI001389CAD0|nr:capsular biosynthesis protein [Campylobacter sp. MIT 19-121]NDJ26574.1 capsular biosynthesis protein [Campylobacter sp. MIT 19-121]
MNFKQKMKEFAGKNVLLLQGPIGPFFNKLAKKLKQNDAKVFKLNFNGGDKFFYPFNAHKYKGELKNFKTFFKNFCKEHKIDYIITYNDCRPVHSIAIRAAKSLQIGIYIFEEGYLRPNFITFEKNGVNANSQLPRDKNFYLDLEIPVSVANKKFEGAFKYMAFFAFWYWLFAFLLAPFYNNRLHHRSLSPLELIPWIRAFYRKFWYKLSEKKTNEELKKLKGKYFVAVLQVFNDTQILKHYEGRSVEHFIIQTLSSFALNTRDKHCLVFKHHPMDRGYTHYGALIDELCKQYKLEGRVFYIHDAHLPSLLNDALGCVVVNSTVGLSALYHNCPLKVCGKAFYDIEGLSYQKPLDIFWKEAHAFKPNYKLYTNFRSYLIQNNQINGNFYKNSFLDI